ncbi:MAG TPA: hypothetical protein VNW74_05015 [Mycobacterium sp.]|jgi:hypothetical protein|nr:hypothetical protein [Mycobacterium sp.]
MDSTTGRARPLVAVGYGPRCVPVMQLDEAAAALCDLLWMIDTAVPGTGEMADLLNRFGAVVDTVSVHQGPGAALDWRDGSGNHIVAVVGSTDDEEQLQAAYRLLHQEVTVTYTDVRH